MEYGSETGFYSPPHFLPLSPAQFQAVHPAAQQPAIAQFPAVSQGSSQQQLIQNFYQQQQQQQQQQQLATTLHQQQLLTQQAALQQKTTVAAIQPPQAQPATASQPPPAQEPAVRISRRGIRSEGSGKAGEEAVAAGVGSCFPILV